MDRMKKIEPDHAGLEYSGRIDFENRKEPEFVFPCSYVKIRFTGTRIFMEVSNQNYYWQNYLGVLLDGKQTKILLDNDSQKRQILPLGEQLEDTEHELMLFKRQDSCHTFRFYGFLLPEEAEVLPCVDKPKRRMEVYGDSVSAGEVSEALEYVGKEDPEHQGEYSNSYYSYAWITARKLHAEIHDIAQGGIALLDGTGWFMEPEAVGMESVYDKIQYHPASGIQKPWDFADYRPQVVVVALGQNDAHPFDYMAEEYDGERADKWRKAYRKFLCRLRGIYPDAEIILATTILNHHENWDRAIGEVCREISDPKIHQFFYSQNGRGTPGHIRIPEAEKMAEELSAFVESLGEEIWEAESIFRAKN